MSKQQPRILILLPPDLLAEIDERRRADPEIPNRTEIIRRLIRIGLAPARAAKREAEMRARIDELLDVNRDLQTKIDSLYDRELDPP